MYIVRHNSKIVYIFSVVILLCYNLIYILYIIYVYIILKEEEHINHQKSCFFHFIILCNSIALA